MFSIPTILAIMQLSLAYAVRDTRRGAPVAPKDKWLPFKLFSVADSIEWAYNEDAAYEGLQELANYGLALCGGYQFEALENLGQSIRYADDDVVSSGSSSGSSDFPIAITSADFYDATEYRDTRVAGVNVWVYVVQLGIWLKPTAGIQYTADGFRIKTGVGATLTSFDAAVDNYDFLIQKVS